MPFQTPITIQKALERVHRHEYVLPAIQREFVWQPEQIATLFDSLMKGYPIGSFLFWNVHREHVRNYKYYDFVRDYHQRDNPHCPPIAVPADQGLVAVLDGQQRLTALNIGLRGSLAVKEPRKWWNSPTAFPVRHLYLNLLDIEDDNEPPFAFLTEEKAAVRDEAHAWFPASRVVDMESGADIFGYIHDMGLTGSKGPFRLLERLHQVVHKDGVIAFYEEDSQDLDKVLHIFIRTNSGGTKLSYSDLLLSIAVAQWTKRDARKEIHGLVDELNSIRFGFALSKDFVLKAGLMLAEIASVGFHVGNFTHENMAVLEDKWPAIAKALKVTMGLVADFGFSASTLSADSALLPIACYLHLRGLDDSYRTSKHHSADREAVRGWLVRSLLKSGIWGSGLDTLLTALREVIKAQGADGFPIDAIEARMAARGKSLRFDPEEVEDLADTAYGDKRAFPLLSLLFRHVDLRNQFHVDHFFPRSRFTAARLTKAGVDPGVVPAFVEQVERLGNLQLLEPAENIGKKDRLPAEWMAEVFAEPDRREAFLHRHDLAEVPEDVLGFGDFYQARRGRMVLRIAKVLGVPATKETA